MTQCISLDLLTYSFRTKKLVDTLLTKKANNNNNINNNITCVVTYRAAIAAKNVIFAAPYPTKGGQKIPLNPMKDIEIP